MRYLAVVSYDGTNYQGWQIQSAAPSIQATIQEKMARILDRPVTIYASGRTDAGAHALGQTFHFDGDIKDLPRFRYSLNALLPPDIHVIDIQEVSEDLHARYSAKSKTYLYRIGTGETDVFQRLYRHDLKRPLDLALMKEAARLFLGEHDFRDFTSKEDDENGFVRTILLASLTKVEDEIRITLRGNGFMRYQVRMMVGALIEVGLGRMKIADLASLIDPKKRSIISYKAPAKGLTLLKVHYED